MSEEQYQAAKERISVLKDRLQAREGKDEFNENRRAIQAAIDELEAQAQQYEQGNAI